MEQSPCTTTTSTSSQPEAEFNAGLWALKGDRVSRHNTNSRRYSASYADRVREEARSSFSTLSSPGYKTMMREEIDPSTYSFTTALQALQARYCLSLYADADGFALNSKWNEAEKYICNPLSGEVPMECLSARTLSGRSFRSLTSRTSPLVYSCYAGKIRTKPCDVHLLHLPIEEEKKMEEMTRDVGDSIKRLAKHCELQEGMDSKEEKKVEEGKGEREEESSSTRQQGQGGCLSWMMISKKNKSGKKIMFLPSSC